MHSRSSTSSSEGGWGTVLVTVAFVAVALVVLSVAAETVNRHDRSTCSVAATAGSVNRSAR